MKDVAFPEGLARIPVFQIAISLSYKWATGAGMMISYVAHEMSEVVLNKPSLQYSGGLSLYLCSHTIQTRMIGRWKLYGVEFDVRYSRTTKPSLHSNLPNPEHLPGF